MKSQFVLPIFLAAQACVASPVEELFARDAKCKSDNCLNALRGDPANGAVFCSANFATATTTVESTVVTTTTVAASVTVTQSTTSITGTVESATTVLAKRGTYSSASAHFVNKCYTSAAKISSACSCFLSTTATGTTTTVISATTSVVSATTTETVTSISTIFDATTTTSTTTSTKPTVCVASATPAIQNGGFESSTTSIAPWYLGSNNGDMQGNWDIIQDISADDTSNSFRGYLPKPSAGYGATSMALMQTLTTCAGTSYTVAFAYRFGDVYTNAYLFLGINGAEYKRFYNGVSSHYGFTSFTFTASGPTTSLTVFMKNTAPTNDNVYILVDQFTITPNDPANQTF